MTRLLPLWQRHFVKENGFSMAHSRVTVSPGKQPCLYIKVKTPFPRGNGISYTSPSGHHFPGEMTFQMHYGRGTISLEKQNKHPSKIKERPFRGVFAMCQPNWRIEMIK